MKAALRRTFYTATFLVVFFGLHACVAHEDVQPQTPNALAATRV